MSLPVRWTLAGFLLVLMSIGAVYLTDPELLGFAGPGRAVSTFVKAYDEKDFNLMLTVVDSRIQRGVTGIGNIFGVNSKNAFDVIPMLAIFAGNVPGSSHLENVRIERKSISGDTASVIASMDEYIAMAQGEQVSHVRVMFTVNHEESGWRIHGMQLVR